jgi:hypothetical protein
VLCAKGWDELADCLLCCKASNGVSPISQIGQIPLKSQATASPFLTAVALVRCAWNSSVHAVFLAVSCHGLAVVESNPSCSITTI